MRLSSSTRTPFFAGVDEDDPVVAGCADHHEVFLRGFPGIHIQARADRRDISEGGDDAAFAVGNLEFKAVGVADTGRGNVVVCPLLPAEDRAFRKRAGQQRDGERIAVGVAGVLDNRLISRRIARRARHRDIGNNRRLIGNVMDRQHHRGDRADYRSADWILQREIDGKIALAGADKCDGNREGHAALAVNKLERAGGESVVSAVDGGAATDEVIDGDRAVGAGEVRSTVIVAEPAELRTVWVGRANVICPALITFKTFNVTVAVLPFSGFHHCRNR